MMTVRVDLQACRRVLAKLRDEGWGDEIDRMSDHAISLLASLDGVNRPTKLTERSASLRTLCRVFLLMYRWLS